MPSTKKLLQAAAGNAGESLYVEDVFSTYLYDGNGSNRSITNGIDLAGEGGLVWAKMRSGTPSGGNNVLYDTERGAGKYLISDLTSAQSATDSVALTSFNSNGFSLGVDNASGLINYATRVYASFTFRKAEKFFDVQTWTGDGTSNRQIAHNLGTTPACIIVKRLNSTSNWAVYHQGFNSGSTNGGANLNLTNAFGNEATFSNNSSAFSDSYFLVSSTYNRETNGSLDTYVAYIFASDAGGFGDDGSENIIKCGSYTGNNNSNGPTVTLGFEPQWVLIKESDMSGNSWSLYDMMRDGTMGRHLRPNDSAAEDGTSNEVLPQATGFKLNTSSGRVNRGSNYIYIAIRRPMKTPESGTEVFTPNSYTGNSTADRILTSSNNPVDLGIVKQTVQGGDWIWTDRLRGAGQTIYSNYTQAEAAESTYISGLDVQSGIEIGSGNGVNNNTKTYISYMLSRATGFMDEVVATPSGYAWSNVPHNLGVTPELLIYKPRASGAWYVMSSALTSSNYYMVLNGTNAATLSGASQYSATATTVSFPSMPSNASTVAYLFATLAGVSKVGSVVHSGTTNVDCGFSAGARFVMAKRTDATGDWYVWDSASGIVAGNDPYVRFNTSDPYVSSSDFIDPLSSGFTLTSSFTAGTYIFLAIA